MKNKRFDDLAAILPQLYFCDDPEKIRSSNYYRVASTIYSFLCTNQKENGAIYDPYMSSTLDHQYHLSNFVLSSIIFFIIEENENYYERAYSCLEYLTNIPIEVNRGSLEFNNFPILLSYILLKKNKPDSLQERISSYISGMKHYGSKGPQNPYGNNFLTLRAINHLLKYKLLGHNDDFESAQDFMSLSMSWQMEDGIFYDYPSTGHEENGIPSISYHSKITLITLLYGLIKQDPDIINRGLKGLEALTKLVAVDGENFYYGRTNNALYGYACGILALRVAANLLRGKKFKTEFAKYERLLFEFCTRNTAQDGHLYIVPNYLEKDRCGFDAYMYVTVYNAFAMSMFLICALIQESYIESEKQSGHQSHTKEIYHLEPSGFLIQKSDKLSVGFNLKGHNYQGGYFLDPRFTGLTPLFLKFKGKDVLPSIAFSPEIYLPQKNERLSSKLFRKLGDAYSEYKNWSYLNHHNPAHGGFIPFYENKKKIYLPIDGTLSTVISREDILIVKSTARFISVSKGGLLPFLSWLVPLFNNYSFITQKQLIKKAVRSTNSILERTIIIGENFICFDDIITYGIKGKLYFGIRTYTAVEEELEKDKIIFNYNNVGLAVMFGQEENLESKKLLCSSKGTSIFWKINCTSNNRKSRISDPIRIVHTIIPFDAEDNQEDSIIRLKKII